MLNENKIKSILTILITIALFIYHGMNYFLPFNSSDDLFSLYKISQWVVMVIFVIFLIYNKFLARLVLGNSYVAGDYEGQSSYYLDKKEEEKEEIFSQKEKDRKNTIDFSIKQSLFGTKISGSSIEILIDEPVSTWNGVLFKNENNTMYFALELHSINSEFGILQLHFLENKVYGFYYSGEAGNKFTYKLTACKKK